jgi:hypothetical protein
MPCEIAVDPHRPVRRFNGIKRQPAFIRCLSAFRTPLQEDDVGGDLRARIPGKGACRAAWQTDGTKEIGTLGDLAACQVRLLVERVARGDEGNETAWTHLVQAAGEEVVVDRHRPVAGVLNAVIAEGDVRDRQIKIGIRAGHLLEAHDPDIGTGIEGLGDAAGERIKFDAGPGDVFA